MAKHINLNFNYLFALLLLGLSMTKAKANEVVDLRFGNHKLPIPSGYFLNATRALEESIVHFERITIKNGYKFPESDFTVMKVESCEEYCNLESPPNYFVLSESKKIGNTQKILWTIKHTNTIDGENFKVGVIVSQGQAIVIVNNVNLWKGWYKKIEKETESKDSVK